MTHSSQIELQFSTFSSDQLGGCKPLFNCSLLNYTTNVQNADIKSLTLLQHSLRLTRQAGVSLCLLKLSKKLIFGFIYNY